MSQRTKLCVAAHESISYCVAFVYGIGCITELQTIKAMPLHTHTHTHTITAILFAPAVLQLFSFFYLSELCSCPYVCVEEYIHFCSVHLCILDQIHSDPNTQVYTMTI